MCNICERCKDEDIAHDSDAFQWKILVIDSQKFVHRQERQIGNLLQALHVTDDGVLLAGLFRFEVKLKGTNQLPIDFRQRQILFPILLFDKLCEIAFAALITADGNQCIVFPYEGAALVVVFLSGANERADFFRILVLSEELFLQ